MRFSRYVFVTACFISHLKSKSLLILNHWSNQLSQQHFPADRVNTTFFFGVVIIPLPSSCACMYMKLFSLFSGVLAPLTSTFVFNSVSLRGANDFAVNSGFAFRLAFVNLLSIWQPPALPHRLQCSTIGRLGLNHRVRDGNGCVP